MTLAQIEIPRLETAIPKPVARFLRTARKRIDSFLLHSDCHGFVPSDYEQAYRVLAWLVENDLLSGTRFCEWGSGLGVVACLADMLEFEAIGIEVNETLVDQARALATDFELSVEFHVGSFIPKQAHKLLSESDTYAWFDTHESDVYSALCLDVSDMDLVYVYPWPDEEAVTMHIFHECADVGAFLLLYGDRGFSLYQKQVSHRSKKSTRA